MENAPRERRGVLSGMMQGGYPFGYLLAAVGMLTIMPHLGWRAMFAVGSLLAVGVLILTLPSPQLGGVEQHPLGSISKILKSVFPRLGRFFSFFVVMVRRVLHCH